MDLRHAQLGGTKVWRRHNRIAMSTSFDTTYEAYPGYDYSISQLFYATKRKLQDVMAGGRYD